MELEAGMELDEGQLLRRDRVGQIDGPGLQGDQALAMVRDGLEDQPADDAVLAEGAGGGPRSGGPGPPVVVVALQAFTWNM